jgi:hypothetical protein
LRKERALQKKQLKKRIAWDIGVWMLLLTSLAGLIGYGGYLAGHGDYGCSIILCKHGKSPLLIIIQAMKITCTTNSVS